MESSTILDAAKGDIDIIKNKYEIARSTNNIDNIVSWMKDAIKNDYQPPKGKKKASIFNNFKQRAYDIPELEKQLFGWTNKVSSE